MRMISRAENEGMKKTASKALMSRALVDNRQPSPPRPGRGSRMNAAFVVGSEGRIYAAAKSFVVRRSGGRLVKRHPANTDTEQCTSPFSLCPCSNSRRTDSDFNLTPNRKEHRGPLSARAE